MKRIVQPELLDTLPPDNPAALRSRRDLRRINAWMGNPGIMTKALQEYMKERGRPARENQSAGEPPAILAEPGAGDGHFLLQVARMTGWQNVNATLIDAQKTVLAETIDAFEELDWRAEAIVADVFDWDKPAEIIVTNLFLHHFEDARLGELLGKISGRAKLFIAVEPHRCAFPSLCGPLLRLIGCNDVTRHDAVVSIRAGFVGDELSALWPDRQDWQLTERRAGVFSHLFVAKKMD